MKIIALYVFAATFLQAQSRPGDDVVSSTGSAGVDAAKSAAGSDSSMMESGITAAETVMTSAVGQAQNMGTTFIGSAEATMTGAIGQGESLAKEGVTAGQKVMTGGADIAKNATAKGGEDVSQAVDMLGVSKIGNNIEQLGKMFG